MKRAPTEVMYKATGARKDANLSHPLEIKKGFIQERWTERPVHGI